MVNPARKPTTAALPEVFTRYCDALEETLRSLVPAEPQALYRMVRYHQGWTDPIGNSLATSFAGKAIRPMLCLLACEALGVIWQQALPNAAALELIHNFSLIHDDIEDGDLERRHRPTVWSLWGIGQAIWAGNAMRILGDGALIGQGINAQQGAMASALLTEAYLEMMEGQYLDIHFEGRHGISVDDYLVMVSRKTGALVRCAMEMGALVATDDREAIEAFRRCGALLGLAFQIRDDILGIWGDEAATGKETGNDIRRRKKTLPVIYGLEHATGAARKIMRAIYSSQTVSEVQVGQVLAILDEMGIAEHAQALVEEKTALALQALANVPISSWAWQQLHNLAAYMVSREQ